MRSLTNVTLFALILGHTVAFADERPPEWSLPPSASAQLADEVDLGWLSLQPPKDYERADLGDTSAYDRAGIKIAAWTLTTDDAVRPTITVLSLPAPNQPKSDANELFQGIMDSLTAKWPDAQRSDPLSGMWNGEISYRCQFRSTNEGNKLQGMVLAQLRETSTFVVSVIHPAETAADRNAFEATVFAALSCKHK